MNVFHILILALVQGITEFLPISSSAHLVLVPALTGWPDQGPMIDLAAHMGTLAAVLLYFRQDTCGLSLAVLARLGNAKAQQATEGSLYHRLLGALILGTIPVVLAGLVFKLLDWDSALRSVTVIAWASIGFGLLLWAADRYYTQSRTVEGLNLRHAFLIGLAQVLALIPGTSRAGITMTAARALGFNRADAARFSMLLAIPTILAGGVLAALDIGQGSPQLWIMAAAVALLSCLFALAAIKLLMAWLERADMSVFVLYRLALGIILLGLVQAEVLA